MSTTNYLQPATTDAMLLRGRSKPLKATSLQDSAPLIPTSLSTSGTNCSRKPSSPSIYYVHLASIHIFLHTTCYMALTTIHHTPLPLLECASLHTISLTTADRGAAPHATEGFYLGPALNHYRCYRILNPRTNSERISETVRWLPHSSIQVPTPTPDETLRLCIQDFITTLTNIKPQQLPHLSSTGLALIRHLQTLFPTSQPQHHPPSTVTSPTIQQANSPTN